MPRKSDEEKDNNSVVESVELSMDDDEETKKDVNTFQDAIRELGSQLHGKIHKKRLGKITQENKLGLIRARALNEYMDANFGYRYHILDSLCDDVMEYGVSVEGFGIEKLIEIVKSIQASFEQTQLPSRMRDMLGR